MNKVTFSTLKKYAKQNKLFHCIKGEFSGMVDGMEWNIYNKQYKQTTIKDSVGKQLMKSGPISKKKKSK